MIKKNKKLLIITSLLTLLPIAVGLVLWNRLPANFATHWGADGQADGYGSLPFAVFAPPLIMLAVQWLCVLVTAKDPGNQGRNRKPFGLVLWIVPVTSNLCCGLMYALALGAEFSVSIVMQIAFGLMFIAIGNYLPKCKMNRTIGIKVPWAYTSEENWNATHRFAGKLWVIGGLITALGAFLPGEAGIWVMVIAMTVLSIVPIIYSYRFYKKEKAEGKAVSAGYSTTDKKILKGSAIFLAVLTVFILYVLFAGEIEFQFREDYLFIDTNMYTDHVVYYDAIQDIELREGNVSGVRVGGYGSFRLLMGSFQNDEFGAYTRYTYYNPEACVVLTVGERTLVISGETSADTQAIYQELLSRTEK